MCRLLSSDDDNCEAAVAVVVILLSFEVIMQVLELTVAPTMLILVGLSPVVFG